jgi:hypothetical protein
MSQDSSLGIGTDYGLGSVPYRSKILFYSSQRPDRLWVPPNLLSNGYWEAVSPEVNRLGPEADHSPPSSAEAKELWRFVYVHSPIRLHGVMLN